jgi:NAD(P)-dependent dehydrogenase (short-subunit alcohol dehydrogenase family)
MNLQGKTALVTGAGQRVGQAIALALASQGANVIVHYHKSGEGALATARTIKEEMGVEAERLSADLSDPKDIEKMFFSIKDWFGRLDVVVNSASAFQMKGVMELTAEDWDHTMAVNLRAPFLLSQGAARLMQNQEEGGVIINIADVAGELPWPRFPHHSVSKAGLIMLTRVLAKSLAPKIRVNAVVPGPVLKPDKMEDARWEKLGEVLPLKRTGSPADVAMVVIEQIRNDFVTGAVWNVDGGDALVGSVDML